MLQEFQQLNLQIFQPTKQGRRRLGQYSIGQWNILHRILKNSKKTDEDIKI
jgi:hypothetical protein